MPKQNSTKMRDYLVATGQFFLLLRMHYHGYAQLPDEKDLDGLYWP